MARVTVEDCLANVENRFDLVIKAAKRAHMLELGEADSQVPIDNDKPTVIALREIAKGLDITKTRKSLAEEDAEAAEAEASAGGLGGQSLLVSEEVPAQPDDDSFSEK